MEGSERLRPENVIHRERTIHEDCLRLAFTRTSEEIAGLAIELPSGHEIGMECLKTWCQTYFDKDRTRNTCLQCRTELCKPEAWGPRTKRSSLRLYTVLPARRSGDADDAWEGPLQNNLLGIVPRYIYSPLTSSD